MFSLLKKKSTFLVTLAEEVDLNLETPPRACSVCSSSQAICQDLATDHKPHAFSLSGDAAKHKGQSCLYTPLIQLSVTLIFQRTIMSMDHRRKDHRKHQAEVSARRVTLQPLSKGL